MNSAVACQEGEADAVGGLLGTLPNFIVIGAAKAGTTWIYEQLKRHPQVYMPRLKELRYFAFEPDNPQHQAKVGKDYTVTTWQEYLEQFQGAAGAVAIGEASPGYLTSEHAARGIAQSLPKAKLIVSLRNPADRCYSAYLMSVRAGEEKRDFDEVIAQGGRCITNSFYCDNVRRYISLFSREQIKIVLFDELTGDERGTLRNLLKFLEVDDGWRPGDSVAKNPGGIPRSALLHQALHNRSRRLGVVGRYVPARLRTYARLLREANLKKAPSMKESARRKLCELYEPDILRLQDLIGMDLSSWLKI